MINTIFWFADNIDQYNHELTTQGISDKTIVFIKDSGEIYVNNKKYGNTIQDVLNDPEIETIKTNINSRIDNVEQDITDINTTLDYVSDRTLIANAGSNINSVGTPSITVTKDAVNNREILTFNYLKGTPGIPGNDGNDGKTPYILNGYWYIDGANTGVKARGEDGIDGKTPYIQNGYWYIDGVSTGVLASGNTTPYDDSSIRQSIQDIIDELEELKNGSSTPGTQGPGGMTQEELARIDELELNLQTLSNTVDALNISSGGMTSEEILDFIDNAIATSDDLLNLIKEHGIDNISTWSGWNDKLNGYLQGYVVGLYTDSNGSSNVTLSLLLQKVNLLRSEVTYISSLQGGEGPTTEVIQNMIDQSIENNTSIIQIKNKYAFEHDDVMEWLGSGFESQVSSNSTFAQIYSNAMLNVSGQITTAVAGLRTEILTDDNEIISGSLNTLVSEYSNGEILNISGLVTKATNSISEADMVASINDGNSNAHLAVKTTAESAATDVLSEYGIDSKTKISTLASNLASEITARTQLGESVSAISLKTNKNSSAIEGIVDASTEKVTASKIWSALASDNSVKSAMRSEFATTVDGEGIASIVKEDISQDFNQASWEAYVAYMTNGIDSLNNTNAAVTSLQLTVDANSATLTLFASYTNDLDNFKDSQDHITALSIATQIADNTSATNILSAKFKPTANEISTAVETQLNASAAGGNWTSFAQLIANDHTTIGSIDTRVGTLESKNIVETSMISKVTGNDGKISAASVVAAINADTGSNVYINADRITMTGNTTFINGIKNIVGQTNIDGGKITTGTISASRIDTDNLTVNAANISGQLIASQIDATNLTVKAANVTGTISADKLDVSAIVGKINSSAGNSAIKINADHVDFTGSITASGLTAGGLQVDKTTTRTQDGVTLTTRYLLETEANGDLVATLTKLNLIDNTIDTDYSTIFEFNSDGSGWIAGSTIGWDTYGNVMICEDGNYPTHFNSDGSGYIAGTGITWDIDGNLKLTNATLSGTTTFVGVTDLNETRRYTDISGNTIKCTDLDENTRFLFDASVTGNNYNLTVKGTSKLDGNVDFGEDVTISGDAYIVGNLDVSGNFSHGSDARRKDIKAYNINPTIESIADAPAIRFTWEGKENDSLHLGTTAQYWYNILPETIKEYKDGTLGLEYDTVALLSVITAAKEIVALKQEIADLKTQLNIA